MSETDKHELKLEWRDGCPSHPWDKEWFIAETTYGDRVVLTALPEEYSYDFKTADETYLKRGLIKRWMQFPDSGYIAPTSASKGDEGRDEIRSAANALLNNLWAGAASGARTHEENWREFERRYPGVKWLHTAALRHRRGQVMADKINDGSHSGMRASEKIRQLAEEVAAIEAQHFTPEGAELPTWEQLCGYWKRRCEEAESKLGTLLATTPDRSR